MATRSPFAGFPKTKQKLRQGKLVFTITPRVLTPRAAMSADGLASLCLLLWIGALLFKIELIKDAPGWIWLPYWGSTLAIHPITRWLFRNLLKGQPRMELDDEEFRIRRWHGWIRFNRKRKHSFAALPHSRTQAEQRRQEFQVREAQMRGKALAKTPYYGESAELVYLDLGQPYYLIEIFGPKEAAAVKTRLEACDAILDNHTRMGPGAIIDPDDEWDKGPGDIDDDWN